MIPSSKYASTEQTYQTNFKYKQTNDTFKTLFPLNTNPDLSVAYTTPINSDFDTVNMGGWNNNSASTYVTKNLLFTKKFGSKNNYTSNVNELAISKSSFSSVGNTVIAFCKTTSGEKYYWGKGAAASSTYGNFNPYLITDFEVNKVIFNISLLYGWTKEQYEKFITLGHLDSNDGYTITPADFMANPDNYYIRAFDVANVGYWDGSQWTATGSTPSIRPFFMVDTDDVSGACSLNMHHFMSKAGTTQMGGGFTIHLYNSSSTNATTIDAFVRGDVISKLENVGSGRGGYVLGDMVSPLTIKPDLTLDEMNAKTASGLTGNFNTLPATEINWCPAMRVFKFDDYTLSNSNETGGSHFDKYDAHLCFALKGTYVYKLLAYIGVYFYTGTLQQLKDSGATPENLKVNGMALGEMNAAGQTTGRWILPDEFDDYKGINKSGSIVHPKYNPAPSGGDDGANEKDMNTITATGNAGMVTYYEINKTGTATATAISDAISKFDITQIGKDLTRNLVSYKAFAVLPVQSHLLSIIHVGGNDLQTEQGVDLYGDAIQTLHKIDLGTIRINRAYNDYRDYAPYTKIEMYVPFCGWFTLPSWAMGKTVSGEMWVDLYNGTVKAIIKASRTVVAEVGGCCAYDIPFVAESTGAKAGAVISSALATVGMTASTIATPNIATATAAISSASNLACALNSNVTTLKGCLGDGSNVNGLNQVWIKVTRPRTPAGDKSIPSAFKHENGIPSGKELTLSAGDGYTQILDAKVEGAMTDREKQMIIDGFRHGLIL